jgi:hypothetical protein
MFQDLVCTVIENFKASYPDGDPTISFLVVTISGEDEGTGVITWSSNKDDIETGTVQDMQNNITESDIYASEINEWLYGAEYTREFESANAPCTYEEYLKISNGMTYSEVVEIIGSEGTETSSASAGGYTSKVYKWDGSEKNSNVVVTFTNDLVVAKAESGLDS